MAWNAIHPLQVVRAWAVCSKGTNQRCRGGAFQRPAVDAIWKEGPDPDARGRSLHEAPHIVQNPSGEQASLRAATRSGADPVNRPLNFHSTDFLLKLSSHNLQFLYGYVHVAYRVSCMPCNAPTSVLTRIQSDTLEIEHDSFLSPKSYMKRSCRWLLPVLLQKCYLALNIFGSMWIIRQSLQKGSLLKPPEAVHPVL